jgi:hypothetical protein
MKKVLTWFAVPILIGFGAGVFILVTHLNASDAAAQTCSVHGTVHTITISGQTMVPDHINGKLCDQLNVINGDDELRLIAFGPHERHVAYDGIAEHALDAHQSFTVTLVQTGTFLIHDHIHDEVHGSFTVTK